MDTGSWSRAVLDCGTLAGTLFVDPGTMDFALVPGLIKGCLGFFQEVPGHTFKECVIPVLWSD
jgi:hypothetical protein